MEVADKKTPFVEYWKELDGYSNLALFSIQVLSILVQSASVER
jgi:hypothetical protein